MPLAKVLIKYRFDEVRKYFLILGLDLENLFSKYLTTSVNYGIGNTAIGSDFTIGDSVETITLETPTQIVPINDLSITENNIIGTLYVETQRQITKTYTEDFTTISQVDGLSSLFRNFI